MMMTMTAIMRMVNVTMMMMIWMMLALDWLPGGHPDELALLTQVAAARPKMLTISSLKISQTKF